MFQSWLGAIVRVDKATRGAKLVATEYQPDGSREQHWKKSREFSCFEDTKNPLHVWKTLAFEVIVSYQTGLPGLCVLVCNKDNISGDVTLAVSMVNENICSHGNIPASMAPSGEVYHLSDGPSVLWCSGSQLVMLSVNDVTLSLHCFSLEEIFDVDTSIYLNWTLSKLWVLGGKQPEGELRVFIRATNTVISLQDTNPPKKLKTTDTNVLLSTVTIAQQGQATPTITKLQDNLIVHSDYASVISCVTEYDNHDPNMLGDQQRSFHYIVGTTYQQMLLFSDGKVLQCISLKCVPSKISVFQVCGSVDLYRSWCMSL